MSIMYKRKCTEKQILIKNCSSYPMKWIHTHKFTTELPKQKRDSSRNNKKIINQQIFKELDASYRDWESFLLNSDYSEARQQKHWKNINFQHLKVRLTQQNSSRGLDFMVRKSAKWNGTAPLDGQPSSIYVNWKCGFFCFVLCMWERGKGSHLIQFEHS